MAIKSRHSAMAISKYRKAISITMCSAFRFFTLERITSRSNTDDILVRTYPARLVRAARRLVVGGCPRVLSLEYAHIITHKSAFLYSKKKNNKIFGDFAHLCNICTINPRNGADELVQYQQL